MNKKYQTNEIDTSMLAVPEQVSVAMDEIAADMREGLLALAVVAGLQVMAQLMEADVSAACGAKGKHNPEPGRDPARHRGGLGHPGRAQGAGKASSGACQRTAPVRWRCRLMSCSTPPSCSARWRWNGCSAGSRPGVVSRRPAVTRAAEVKDRAVA